MTERFDPRREALKQLAWYLRDEAEGNGELLLKETFEQCETNEDVAAARAVALEWAERMEREVAGA